MRHKERFCGWQVRGNVSQILSRALFCAGENTLQVQPPPSPPHHPLLAVAQISSRRSCQLQRECLLFSHSLWKERGSHACTPGTCRRLSSGLWSSVFSHNPAGVVTPDRLTSQLEVLKPTRGARDFLMSPSQAERWKAASRGVGQRGSWAGDTTRKGKKQVEWRTADLALRELQPAVSATRGRQKERNRKESLSFNIVGEGRGRDWEGRRTNQSVFKWFKRVLYLKYLSWKNLFMKKRLNVHFAVLNLGLFRFCFCRRVNSHYQKRVCPLVGNWFLAAFVGVFFRRDKNTFFHQDQNLISLQSQ